ncbi:hypothetical protein GLOIN_2v1765707 [Rhizophagus clarus]|uniref:Uncharacterized protein n=1 Tax=Rhizophagus clarus TaxID=94130 RepID=A0A8H3R1V0_9GLOM|nr:hypothetical protein GLOIN_2v1765707 [Rhizophagus clarus]
MSAIVTKYVAKHKLNKDMSNEELSQHAPALLELLIDKLKRDKDRQRFQKGYNFSKKQAFVLVPDQRICGSRSWAIPKEGGDEVEEVNICQVSNIIPDGETIESIAQRIVQDNLSEKEVKAIAKALTITFPNPMTTTSCLNNKTTCASNKIQKERRVQRKNEGINFSDHFSLESVKERLDLYDVFKTPDVQALADVMIMLYIRPAEIKDLRISNGKRDEEQAKLFLTWIQNAISSGLLRDPGVPGVKCYLRKLGAVFAVVSNGVKNLSDAMTIASQALRHSPDNHASPAQNYTIVNF